MDHVENMDEDIGTNASQGSATARRRNPRGQGDRLREELLDAADELLAESGDAQQLSLRQVAKRVGIAATSIYLHFPDIAELKEAVALRGFVELERARHAASRDITDPAEALLARICAFAQFALAYPGRYRLMFGPYLPTALAYGAAQSPSRRALEELAQSIQRCQEAGVARLGADPLRLAILLWASVHGFLLLRLDRPQFPWPPIEGMVTEATQRLVGLM
jgi:AcrR family transcriptional regulator